MKKKINIITSRLCRTPSNTKEQNKLFFRHFIQNWNVLYTSINCTKLKQTSLNVKIILVYGEFLPTTHRVKLVLVFVDYFALYCAIARQIGENTFDTELLTHHEEKYIML